ncbi:hypothetical protein Tco_1193118 [Tanacetum coccineum]
MEKAGRLPPIEEAKTILSYDVCGVLSTTSQSDKAGKRCKRTDMVKVADMKCSNPDSIASPFSQIASFAASVSVIYPASVGDKAIMCSIIASQLPAHPSTATEDAVPVHTVIETYKNTTPKKCAYFDAKAEVIHLILTRIGDDIYSTIDACTTTKEMWIAIERLQQGESLNKQDVKTNLFWKFGKFTSRDGESIESYYFRFYKMMNEMVRNKLEVATMQVNVHFIQQLQPEWSRFMTVVKQTINLDKESIHKLFDILKQYQTEVNEIHAEKLFKNANPLSLVATAQHNPEYHNQAPKPYKSIATSSKQTTTYNDPEQAQRDTQLQKNLALVSKYIKNIYSKPTNNNHRTSSNTRNKNMDNTPRFGNDRNTGQFVNERTKTVAEARETRVKDYAYHKEKMLLCKQAEKGVALSADQGDWLDDTDEEPD